MSVDSEAIAYGGRTAWARNLAAPVRSFLSTEEGGAIVMLGAAIAALVWANAPGWHSYESVWTTQLSIRVGSAEIGTDLRHWVNEGLMTLFFLVVGLEAKRQLDLGELRERRRLAIPVVAALGGVTVPILIYLAFNAGRSGAHGWAAAMSTDTAFALGTVALVTPRTATRIRVFLLTLAVVDDLAALVVIATVYSSHVSFMALGIAIALFAGLIALRYAPFGRSAISIGLGVAIWVAMFKSGIDPVISGLAIGLATSAYPPAREDLERATALTRSFREQPTPELARSAQQSLQSAISANERLQYDLHPWTSYVIVPLFALANAGIHLTGKLMSDAISSPITLGILIAYLVGKPIGIFAGSWLASRPSPARSTRTDQRAGADRRRRVRRDRLHRLHPCLEPCVQRRAPRRGEARGARDGGDRAPRRVGGDPADQAPTEQPTRAADRTDRHGHPRPRGGRRPRPRPHSWPRRCARHAARVRRLRMSLLRAGRERHSRAPLLTTAMCATCGGTYRSTTSTPPRSSRPRHPRPPPHRASSGRCTTPS